MPRSRAAKSASKNDDNLPTCVPDGSGASHASLPSVVVHHATPSQSMTACVDALDASRSEDHDPHQDHWLLTRLRRTTTPVRPWRYTRLRSRWCARNSGSNVATKWCVVQHSGVWPAHMARGTVSCACMQCRPRVLWCAKWSRDQRDVLADSELQCQRRRWLQCAAAQRERGAHARKARTLVRPSQHGVTQARTRRLSLTHIRTFHVHGSTGWGNITWQPRPDW